MESEIDLVIYHGGCPDGTAAAWCFWRGPLGRDNSKLYYGKIGDTPPDVTDKNVVFVDFTYPVNDMDYIINTAKSVIVLDHHKTALHLLENKNPKLIKAIIDMDRSGAQIAWDYLNASQSRPWYIDDIADRDLWTWKVPGSKEVTHGMNGLNCYNTMLSFDNIQYTPREYYALTGKAIMGYEDKIIDSLVKRAILCTACPGPSRSAGLNWTVKLVECDYTYASEVGNRLVSDGSCDFAVMYRYDIVKNEWLCSCRADPKSNIDLTTILPKFDSKAGGHAKAAGMCIRSDEGGTLRTYFRPN